jgi:2-succinyl-6-hydroxy-2,4-cyclohexadiene-1-carboxylate synthase
MPIIDLSNKQETIQYHYEEKGNGPPILLLHGFTGSSIDWQMIADELSRQYRVITLDLPGHGKTVIDPPDEETYSMRWTAVDISYILDELEIEQVHLVGYSMGGRMALYFAINHGQRLQTLTLASTTPGIEDDDAREERKKEDRELADNIEEKGIDWFVAHWQSLPLWHTQNDALKERLRTRRAQNDPEGLAYSLRGMGQGAMPSLWGDLGRLPIPVKLIAGEDDEKYVKITQRMDKLIPDSDVTLVNGAGHAVHVENPEAVTGALLAFLHEVTR